MSTSDELDNGGDKEQDLSDIPLLFVIMTCGMVIFFAVDWTHMYHRFTFLISYCSWFCLPKALFPRLHQRLARMAIHHEKCLTDGNEHYITQVKSSTDDLFDELPETMKAKSTLQLAAMSSDGFKRVSAVADKDNRFKLIVERNPFVKDLLKKVRREILQLRMQQNRQRAVVESRVNREALKTEQEDAESLPDKIRGYIEALLCCRLRHHIRLQQSKRALRDMDLSLPGMRLGPRHYIIDRSRDIEMVFRIWLPRGMLESRPTTVSQDQPHSGDTTPLPTKEEKKDDDVKGAIRAFRFWAFGEIDEFESRLERFTDSWLRSEFALIGMLELIVHRIQEISHLPPRSCSDVCVLAKIVEIELLGWAAKQDWQIEQIQRRRRRDSTTGNSSRD